MISMRAANSLIGALALGLGVGLFAPIESRAQVGRMRCSISTSTGMNFGGYDVFGTVPLDGTAQITLECLQVGPADQVLIEVGRGGEKSFQRRAMRSGRYKLEYNLYLDPAHSVIWGDGTGGTGSFRARPPEGRPLVIPIFGRVPPRQNVGPGSYSDRIAVTVVY